MVYGENTKTQLGEFEGSIHPKLSLIEAMFEGTSGSYDTMVRLATLGMDRWWKRRLIQAIPPDREYHRILDLACGTGSSTLKIAEEFPRAEIVGIDLTKSYLEVAAKKIKNRHIQNIELIHLPVERMNELPGEFDLVIGSFVPKLVDLERLGSACEEKISPNGALVLHDFIVPTQKMLRIGFRTYWIFIRLFMRMQKSWLETSQNLFRIIWESNWQQEIQRVLTSRGFTDFYCETQPFQVARIVRAVRQA